MDQDLWQLEVNGDRRTLREWGITNPVLTRVNAGVDELRFHVPRTSADGGIFSGPPFEFEAPAVLWRGETRYFSGLFDDPAAGGSSDSEGWACRVVGPWQALEDIIYQQPYVVRTLPLPNIARMSTRVVFGKDAWGRKVSIDSQIQNIASYALSQGAGLFALGELDGMHEPPLSEARDITCAAAIRRMMDMVPDSVAWFDYQSGATPLMRVQRRTNLEAVSIDVGAGTIVRGLSSMRARNDLLARGVVIVFQTTEEDEETGRSWIKHQEQTAGATSGRRVIRATISLGLQDTDRPEPVPNGLAAAYYAAVNVLHYSGDLTLKEADCSGILRPGRKLNLTNGLPAWETMNAVVQQTTENLYAGETEVTLGPPSSLGIVDFVDLQRYWRSRPQLSDFAGLQDNGTEGVDDGADNPGVDGFGGGAPDVDEGDREGNPDAGRPPSTAGGKAVNIPYCEDGVQTSVTVYKAK